MDNVTFNVDTLFPSNKSYYAYRCASPPPPLFQLSVHFSCNRELLSEA